MLSLIGLVAKGSTFDISNGVAGLLMYAFYFIFSIFFWGSRANTKVFLGVSIAGVLFSLYLIYILSFVLGDFCIVCYGIHTVNFSLLYTAISEYREIKGDEELLEDCTGPCKVCEVP